MTHNKFGLQGPYTKAKRRLINWRRLGCLFSVLFVIAFWAVGVYGWFLVFAK